LKSHTEDQENIRQYLLGRLSEAKLPEIEERLLTDSAFYEELLIAEDELIDQHLSNELSESERASFESHFLVPRERQQKVRFARAFRKYVNPASARESTRIVSAQTSQPEVMQSAARPGKKGSFLSFLGIPQPIVAYSLAAVVVLIAFGVSLVVFRSLRGSTSHEPRNLATAVLTPGLTRDERGDINEVAVRPDTEAVRLELALYADQYQSYETELQDINGTSLMSRNDLPAHSVNGLRTVSLEVPATLLRSGDYRIKLSGHTANNELESIATYALRVQR
jgi:hypothetical protein